ncbi:hypothetical protein [Corynebacterium tuscaniense]|uniref:hypothetical protein n=1 Tax=Corynebacterium tuscaniense TaxID=302449 RepID=UPI00050EE9BC|nr:hypothetical protein [Corynebacterium tuscaniense]KGF25151.1 hypothetical protein HMPREF2129_00555 [Corynebacterium tuscaniense DNF00037]
MRAKLTTAALSCLLLTACGTHPEQHALQDALAEHAGDASVTLHVSDVYPKATQVLLVCPYAGQTANDMLGRHVFRNLEDANDATNWVLVQQPNNAVNKVALERSHIDLCKGAADPVLALNADAQMRFERRDGVWALERR